MSREQNIAAQERFGEAAVSGDFDVFDEVMSPDVVDHDPAPDQGPGPEGFKGFFKTMRSAFPDFDIQVEHMTATDDDDVAIAYTISGTHEGEFQGVSPTGRRITARGVQIGHFEDGRLVERWGSSDQLSIMQQIGAIGEPGGEQDKGLVDKLKDKLTGQ